MPVRKKTEKELPPRKARKNAEGAKNKMKNQTQTMPFIPQMEPWFDQREADSLYQYITSGGWVTEFKKTREFEELIAAYTGARYCIVVNNGTISLSLALLAFGIRPGDEVIVPNLTMIATANAAVLIGARPVFVDVEAQTLCLDINKVKEAISNKTKALVHVSFNGRSNDLNNFSSFCRENNIAFIEDAAQSLGSSYQGRHLGRYGQIGSFSFSAPKIISTGQGGALITDSDDLYQRLKKLKDFGRDKGGNDIHDSIGYNFKFTDIQAVIGIEQMEKLPGRIKRKKEVYQLYVSELSALNKIEFIPTELQETAPWFIDIYVEEPDKLSAFLKERNIGTRRIYPPINIQKAYRRPGHFPVTENYSRRGLWLPSAVKLTDEQIKYICDQIKEYYQ